MNTHKARYYEFGPFRLNATERLLQRDQEIVPLTPKLIDTLVVLVENSGHVLSKESLMQSLWPDTFVEESSLTQNVSLLRKALAEIGGGERYIETIPKRGYRFVADVREVAEPEQELVMHERVSTSILIEEEQADETPVAARNIANWFHRKRMIAVTAIAACVALGAAVFAWSFRGRQAGNTFAPNSIAVLPFRTIGANEEAELLGLGMADAVIVQIARMKHPTVLPTSSVFKFTKRKEDAISIARDLGVEAVLDGTVQIEGDRARVTAQLIRTSDGTAVWSEKFDRPYTSIFALQDSVSQGLAASVASAFTTEAQSPNRETASAEAYQAYLMGMYFWNRRTKENLAKAVNYLEQAVTLDPDFARAHGLLADCYFLSSQNAYKDLATDEPLKRAETSAQRALDLDATIAEAHTARAGVAFRHRRYDEADREFRKALELNPNYAVAHLRYGYFLLSRLKLDEALAAMKHAQRLDPISPTSNAALGYLQFMARDFDGAINSGKIAVELLPDSAAARFNLGQAYALKRMFPEAIAEFDKLVSTEPHLAARGKITALGLAGRTEEAKQILRDLTAKADHHQLGSVDLATLYSNLGEKDLAFDQLEIALQRYGREGLMVHVAKLRFDPQLDLLRSEKRFTDYLRRLEAPTGS